VWLPHPREQVAKFERMMRKKNVRVEYVSAGDPRLNGAVGQTVLDGRGRIKVRLARSGGTPLVATLTEELVHVNQLRKMGRQAGGRRALHGALLVEGPLSDAIRASMEGYAKGRVSLTKISTLEKRKLRSAQRSHLQAMKRAAGSSVNRPTRFWAGALGRAPRSSISQPAARRAPAPRR
jgi:hypothetical protein